MMVDEWHKVINGHSFTMICILISENIVEPEQSSRKIRSEFNKLQTIYEDDLL